MIEEKLMEASQSQLNNGYDGLPITRLWEEGGGGYYIPDSEDPQTPPVPQDEDEHEPMFIQPHDPDYVPEPIYPKYIPLEDEHVFPVEEQPLPPVILYLSYCSDVLSGIRY
ncbi:hypothetical protein Tco_0364182 [Tanacetum coccineum]